MHSKSCLAVCLPLSAFIILLYWFLKGFGCSVSSQPTDRFWQSHTVRFPAAKWWCYSLNGWAAKWTSGWVGRWSFPTWGLGPEATTLSQRRRWRALALSLEMTLAPWKSPGAPVGSEPGTSLQHIWQHPGPREWERGQEIKGRDYPVPSVSLHAMSSFKLFQHRRNIKNQQWVQWWAAWNFDIFRKSKKTHKECVHAFYGLVGWVYKKQMNCRGRKKGHLFVFSASFFKPDAFCEFFTWDIKLHNKLTEGK